mgnify:CR=1 FL=1
MPPLARNFSGYSRPSGTKAPEYPRWILGRFTLVAAWIFFYTLAAFLRIIKDILSITISISGMAVCFSFDYWSGMLHALWSV